MEAIVGLENGGFPRDKVCLTVGERRRLVIEEAYRHRGDLHRALMARLRSQEVVDDAVQETFVRFMSVEGIEEIGNPRGYLFRMATNLSIDQMRRARSRVVNEDLVLHDEHCVSDEPTPEQSLLHRQLEKLFDKALSELPLRSREIFCLHRFEGLGTQQIAHRFGISQRMVQKLLARTLMHFRRRLAGAWLS